MTESWPRTNAGLRSLLLFPASFLLSGCVIYSTHGSKHFGDAKVIETTKHAYPSFLFPPGRNVTAEAELPRIYLHERASLTFRVRGLSSSAFPGGILASLPASAFHAAFAGSGSTEQARRADLFPWSDCVIGVKVEEPNGMVRFERDLELKELNWLARDSSIRFATYAKIPGLAPTLGTSSNVDVTISIKTPASKASAWIQLRSEPLFGWAPEYP